MRRDVQFVKAIDRPYVDVRDALADDPAILGDADTDGIAAHLNTRVGGTDLTRTMRVEIVEFDEPAGQPARCTLIFRGDAVHHAELFPHLEARLDAVPISEERTALFFVGTYKPPMGLLGGAVDALALHHRAEESLRGWFGSVTSRIGG